MFYSLVLCGAILLLGGFGFWILDPGVFSMAEGMGWCCWEQSASACALVARHDNALCHRLVRNDLVMDLQITPGEVRSQVMGFILYKVAVNMTAVHES